MANDDKQLSPENAKRVLAVVKGSTTASAKDLDVGRDEVLVWPHLLYRELIAAMAVMVFIWICSLAIDAPLETIADPSHSPNPAKSPWYFVCLQELLVYFDPWLAGVIIPGMILGGLAIIPYLDPGKAGMGQYTFKARPFAVSFFSLGLLIWLVLMIIGTYFRGPAWAWYWPWESWSIPKEAISTINLPTVIGAPLILLYFAACLVLPILWKKDFYKALGPVKYATVMFFVASMLGVLVKIALRLFFDVKYVLTTPWFNI